MLRMRNRSAGILPAIPNAFAAGTAALLSSI
jgi:hypothetical protein